MAKTDAPSNFHRVVARQIYKTMSYLEAINAGTQTKITVKADLWQLADNLKAVFLSEGTASC